MAMLMEELLTMAEIKHAQAVWHSHRSRLRGVQRRPCSFSLSQPGQHIPTASEVGVTFRSLILFVYMNKHECVCICVCPYIYIYINIYVYIYMYVPIIYTRVCLFGNAWFNWLLRSRTATSRPRVAMRTSKRRRRRSVLPELAWLQSSTA